jgi:tetratricopeptide (TPR) repeat protein
LAYGDGRYEDAVRYYSQARPILEKAFGAEHPNVASVIGNEGEVLWKLKRLDEAEPLLRQALAMKERLYAPGHASIAISQHALAGVLRDGGKLTEAEALYRRAIEIRETANNPGDLAESLRDYAALLRTSARADLAAQYEQRAAGLK